MPVAGSAAPGPVERDFDTRVRVQRTERHAAAEPTAAERLGQRAERHGWRPDPDGSGREDAEWHGPALRYRTDLGSQAA